jgi:hypothetical protein
MDTDSAYMALSANSLDEVIKPTLREQFYEEYGDWFPKPFCPLHRQIFIETKLAGCEWKMLPCCQAILKYDTRTPGLFKEEFKGIGMIALNSKTYFCWSEEESKYSSKGLSKGANRLTKECFMDVLKTGESKTGRNRGFVRKNNTTYTYEQVKRGLTYFYAKRQVAEDGVSTSSINC